MNNKAELQKVYEGMSEEGKEAINEMAEMMEMKPWQAIAVGIFTYKQQEVIRRVEARSYVSQQLAMNEPPKFSLVH